jgi:hypothetical protein
MTPYLSEPRSGVAGLFLGTLNDAKWSPLVYCLDSIISVPGGRGGIAGWVAVKTKLELAPKVLSRGPEFQPILLLHQHHLTEAHQREPVRE